MSDQLNLIYKTAYVNVHYKYSLASYKLISASILSFWKYLTIIMHFALAFHHYTKIYFTVILNPKHIYSISGLPSHSEY